MPAIKKAVIPAAGLGTRFLPATKSIPKGIIPIIDTPMIQFVLDEAVRAGVEEIILITSPGDAVLDDYFGPKPELERMLRDRGKSDLADLVRGYAGRCKVRRVVQKDPMGLGHAVLLAAEAVGNEPFFVLLADEIIHSKVPSVAQLAEVFSRAKKSVVGIMEVPAAEVSKYGVISGPKIDDKTYRIETVVEKPSPEKAPSRFALPGRYLFTPKLFSHLEKVKPGKNGEIQLTDGMEALAKDEGLLAYLFEGDRYDTGNRLGYIEATIAFALMREDLKQDVQKILKKYGAGS